LSFGLICMQTGLFTGVGNRHFLRVILIDSFTDLGGTALFREQRP
jgi:hypothetical protein